MRWQFGLRSRRNRSRAAGSSSTSSSDSFRCWSWQVCSPPQQPSWRSQSGSPWSQPATSPGDLCDPGDDPRVRVTVDVPTTLVRWAPLSHTARAVAHLLLLVPLAVALDLLYPVWLVLVARRGWSTTAKERLVVTEQWTADVLAHAWLVSATPPRPRWAELTSARRSTGSNR